MREIKFRAWDKDNKVMLANHEINYSWLQSGDFKNFIPTQYTGLKDKNGKEIYEGDIVFVLDNTGGGSFYEIKWNQDVYEIVGDNSDEYLSMMELEGCEIQGNIYQNPELIKATK